MIEKSPSASKAKTRKSLVFRLPAFAALFALLGNCATVPLNALYIEPFDRPDHLSGEFAPDDNWILTDEAPAGAGAVRLRFERARSKDESHSPGEGAPINVPLEAEWWRSREDGRRPGLLVAPILGGNYRISSHFADYFSRNGYHCLLVKRPEGFKDLGGGTEQLDANLREAVRRDRAALNWFANRPEVAEEALGSFGISYGGIKNVILAGAEPRLRVNVFALAGGGMDGILGESNQNRIESLREMVMRERHMDLPAFMEMVRKSFRSDPLRFAPYVDARDTLLILARFDRTVPAENGERLRERLGYPETLYLPAGHYSAALFTGLAAYPFVERRALAFYDENLEPLLETS